MVSAENVPESESVPGLGRWRNGEWVYRPRNPGASIGAGDGNERLARLATVLPLHVDGTGGGEYDKGAKYDHYDDDRDDVGFGRHDGFIGGGWNTGHGGMGLR